ncbi:glycosyltransferase family 9 protein [Thermodesulfovibrio yellowstonii]|uniref:Glycosyl transferase, family 9 n=1 Tax=Thermodesulfovibrio yellowstonii (strain ATCC 51303 / DSM 11347 / YP87) TaxID=289376 RepID=B5YJ62_THEYD|nr:glycosyltransferase family 9 protein [Thermodesulfovibrio yellowstonii]ACI21547.1 glycosyl transferase, family 9 [Thermodesulfovibrio yellowstonii DSM 11347]
MKLRIRENLLYFLLKIIKKLDQRQTELKYFNPDEVRNILVVSSTAIGDTLMSTPAIRAIREKYPKAKIIAHFNVKNMELFENNPHIDGIIPYYRGWKKFFKTIREFRKHKFDVAVILHGNEPQATPMAYLGEARFIVKVPNSNRFKFLLSNSNELYTWDDFTHGVEARLKSAELIGCNIRDKRMVLPIQNEGEDFVKKFLKQNNIDENNTIIGFQVGASTVSRMWLPERFIELGKKLIQLDSKIKIIITGSPSEYSYCQKIAQSIGKGAVVSAGKIPLKYLPSLIKKLRVLVTGDTGIMHMAIALGTPIIGLFAVSDPNRSGAYYDLDKHFIIKKDRTCEPCISKKCKYPVCMESISVEEVYKVIIKFLNL